MFTKLFKPIKLTRLNELFLLSPLYPSGKQQQQNLIRMKHPSAKQFERVKIKKKSFNSQVGTYLGRS